MDFITFHFRLIRQSAFNATGGIVAGLETAQDYDLCLKLSETTGVGQVRKPLYRYRIVSTGLTQGQALRQVAESAWAVEQALYRRGVEDRFGLEVSLNGTLSLTGRSPGRHPALPILDTLPKPQLVDEDTTPSVLVAP